MSNGQWVLYGLRRRFYALLIAHCALLPSVVCALPPNFQQTSFVSGLAQPTSMEFAPDGRLFVNEKAGRVRVVKGGLLLPIAFLTLSVDTNSERGLLGIAFDPQFSANRFVYVYYTRTTAPIKNRVSRFTASTSNPDVVQAGSEVILLDDIPSDAGNHNGGAIHFGLDGKLYVAVGDGGTVHTNAQLLSSLSGKILRINPDGTIPSDNPFVSTSGARGEVWAYGLRNPFTFSVDPVSGKIHINDVGENTYEEVNLGAVGANYGWPTCEGPRNTGVGTCTSAAFTYPLTVYTHSVGRAITGGAFYCGTNFPSTFTGNYFFSDYLGGFLKSMDASNQVTDFGTISSPVDLKIGPDGALYYAAINTGVVFKIAYASPTSGCDVNGSSATDIADVQLCVNQAIGVSACTTADINKDGQCTVVDVQRVVNAALGGPCVIP